MGDYAICVFDVGKTNKKLLIFDQDLQLIDSVYASIDEYREGSINYEDLPGIESWFLQELANFAKQYPIKAISVSTHGATSVCIDRQGKPVVPVVSYTTEPGQEFHQAFFREMGERRALQEQTATPVFSGLINLAQGIYFVKKRFPQGFDNTFRILHYPQYFGYLLTGQIGAEPTYTGCHTYLWDFHQGGWSSVAEKLGIMEKLPATLHNPWDLLGQIKPEIAASTGLSPEVLVTYGVHDSNAALLPYLIKTGQDFVLNSTGTWCVCMHPSKRVVFEPDDFGKIVFFLLDVFSQPVKTAIFMGGMEFEKYTELLKSLTGRQEFPPFDPARYQRIVQDRELFILPSVLKGTGQFPDSEPRIYERGRTYPLEAVESGREVPSFLRDFSNAYAVLNLSLAIQTRVALKRTGSRDGMAIFVEGGFRQNEDYNALLSALFPRSVVSLTNLNEATAFGTAILAKLALEGNPAEAIKDSFELEKIEVEPVRLPGIEGYMERFLELL